MLTDLQWRYAKHQRDEQGRDWFGDAPWFNDAMVNHAVAFQDMENRQFEQDLYDEYENPRCTYSESFEHHQHHHELAEPVPRHQLDVERITQLLENTHG